MLYFFIRDISRPQPDLPTGLSALKWEYSARAANRRLQITAGAHLRGTPAAACSAKERAAPLLQRPKSPAKVKVCPPLEELLRGSRWVSRGQQITRLQRLFLILHVRRLPDPWDIRTRTFPPNSCKLFVFQTIKSKTKIQLTLVYILESYLFNRKYFIKGMSV